MKKWLKWVYDVLPFKKQLFLLLRRLPIPQSLYRHLHFKGVFSVMVDDRSFKIKHYGFELENEIFWKGLDGWEKTTFKVWSVLSRKANCIIDIGANTGIFALIAKAVHESATVVAFEPVKRVMEKLKVNNKLNQFDINAVEMGVSNFDGSAIIYDTPSDHIYSVTINRNFNGPDQYVIPKEIQVTKLSSYAEANHLQKVELIKVDVETHEPEVLEGMIEILKKDRPAIIIEILNDEVALKVNGILSTLDYSFFILDDYRGPQPAFRIEKCDFRNFLVCTKADADYLVKASVIKL